MTPEYEITISPTGQVKVHVKGASGARCMKLADAIREIIGHENSRTLTSEFYGPDRKVRIDAHVNQRQSS